MITVLIPSRGLISSRTLESVGQSLRGKDGHILFSSELGIPDCFNDLSERFMESGGSHAWFVEEDVVPPHGALDLLINLDTDIAFIDYPLKQDPSRGCYDRDRGKLIWVGMGCTLIRRRVFEILPRPWFRCDKQLVSYISGSSQKEWGLKFVEGRNPEKYGGQDVFFCTSAVMVGCSIGIVEGKRCIHPAIPCSQIDSKPVPPSHEGYALRSSQRSCQEAIG